MADLTTLYRGVDQIVDEFTPKSTEALGNVGQGRWWNTNPNIAKQYAKGLTTGTGAPKLGGVVYSMDVDPSKALSKSSKFAEKLGRRGYDHLAEFGKKPNVYLATKELIKEGAPKINWGQTLGANLDVLGSKGLGFLKNNAFRTLAMLGSLPAQVGIMALSPTTMGNAEIPSHWRPPAHITGGNDGYRASRPASERRHTGHGKSGMGRDPRDRMAMGGLIDLYRYGGFI
jgi:hypothetical protein